jgi:predicted MFS family arabinose efflux permease
VGYATPPQWFERRRGFATGLASAGLGVGLVVVAPTASLLVADIGWRGAFVALAAGLAVLLLVAAFLIADDPDHVGAETAVEFPDGRPTTTGTWREQLATVADVARSEAFVLLFVGYVLLYGTLYVILNHVVNFAGELGVREAGVLAVSVVGVTTTVTRLAVGAVADRLGRLAMFVVCGGVMSVALLALPAANGALALLAVAGLFGVGYGGTGALMSSVPADLFGGDNLNAVFGLVSLSLAVPGLVTPAAAGYGFDQLGTYTPVFLVTGVVGLVGAALVGAAAAASPRT